MILPQKKSVKLKEGVQEVLKAKVKEISEDTFFASSTVKEWIKKRPYKLLYILDVIYTHTGLTREQIFEE